MLNRIHKAQADGFLLNHYGLYLPRVLVYCVVDRVLGDKYKQRIPYQIAHSAWERNIVGLSARMKQYFIENVLPLNLQGSWFLNWFQLNIFFSFLRKQYTSIISSNSWQICDAIALHTFPVAAITHIKFQDGRQGKILKAKGYHLWYPFCSHVSQPFIVGSYLEKQSSANKTIC